MTIMEIAEYAKELALVNGGHMPTLIVEGSLNSAVCHLPELPGDHKEKCRTLLMAGVSLVRKNMIGQLRRVFLVCEGWLSFAREGRLPDLPPSKDPQRKEVLLVSEHDFDTSKRNFNCFEIVRDDKGKIIHLPVILPADPSEAQMASPLIGAFLEGFRSGMKRSAS